jgi:Polyketide cyclase / dehydrase and lipid transport
VASESRHVSTWIDRPASEVYEYASDPVNLPHWAPGLGSAVENIDGRWFVDSPMGRVGLVFAQRNDFGILDHDVTLPTGETVRNPVRVLPNGDGCDVVFTVRRRPGMSEADLAADVDAVTKDMATLRGLFER